MAVTTLQLPVRPRAARRPRPPGYASQMTFVATGLIPILALFVIFAFAPVGIVLWLSLRKYNQLAPVAPFIGLRNFEFAFTNDALFINARIDTFLFGTGDPADAVARARLYIAAGADCVYPLMAPPEVFPVLRKGIEGPLPPDRTKSPWPSWHG